MHNGCLLQLSDIDTPQLLVKLSQYYRILVSFTERIKLQTITDEVRIKLQTITNEIKYLRFRHFIFADLFSILVILKISERKPDGL